MAVVSEPLIFINEVLIFDCLNNFKGSSAPPVTNLDSATKNLDSCKYSLNKSQSDYNLCLTKVDTISTNLADCKKDLYICNG